MIHVNMDTSEQHIFFGHWKLRRHILEGKVTHWIIVNKINHNSKNKNGKNLKIDFSFGSS